MVHAIADSDDDEENEVLCSADEIAVSANDGSDRFAAAIEALDVEQESTGSTGEISTHPYALQSF